MKNLNLLLLICLCSVGCSKPANDSCVADACYYIPYLSDYFDYESKKIQIETSVVTNRGAPLYLLIKKGDFADFLSDSYLSIAENIASKEKEEDTIATLCLLPGENQVLEMKLSEEEPIAFYALYTHPGTEWKAILEPIKNFKKIHLLLGECEIASLTVE